MSTETTRTSATMTAGELIAILATFPADFPVTIGCPDNESPDGAAGEYHYPEWLNIEGAWIPERYEDDEYEGPSIILMGANDFDSRQW